MKTAAKNPSQNISKDEWFTPTDIIEAARNVLGEIDLDPASCGLANETVRAKRYYSIDDDGLIRNWESRVWLNPPYSAPNLDAFVIKLGQEIQKGNTASALLLVPSWTEYPWYQYAFQEAQAMVLFLKRIKFFHPSHQKHARPVFGSTLFYFGDQEYKFALNFKKYGTGRCFN